MSAPSCVGANVSVHRRPAASRGPPADVNSPPGLVFTLTYVLSLNFQLFENSTCRGDVNASRFSYTSGDGRARAQAVARVRASYRERKSKQSAELVRVRGRPPPFFSFSESVPIVIFEPDPAQSDRRCLPPGRTSGQSGAPDRDSNLTCLVLPGTDRTRTRTRSRDGSFHVFYFVPGDFCLQDPEHRF